MATQSPERGRGPLSQPEAAYGAPDQRDPNYQLGFRAIVTWIRESENGRDEAVLRSIHTEFQRARDQHPHGSAEWMKESGKVAGIAAAYRDLFHREITGEASRTPNAGRSGRTTTTMSDALKRPDRVPLGPTEGWKGKDDAVVAARRSARKELANAGNATPTDREVDVLAQKKLQLLININAKKFAGKRPRWLTAMRGAVVELKRKIKTYPKPPRARRRNPRAVFPRRRSWSSGKQAISAARRVARRGGAKTRAETDAAAAQLLGQVVADEPAESGKAWHKSAMIGLHHLQAQVAKRDHAAKVQAFHKPAYDKAAARGTADALARIWLRSTSGSAFLNDLTDTQRDLLRNGLIATTLREDGSQKPGWYVVTPAGRVYMDKAVEMGLLSPDKLTPRANNRRRHKNASREARAPGASAARTLADQFVNGDREAAARLPLTRKRVEIVEPPKLGYTIGELIAVEYRKNRPGVGAEFFIHKCERKPFPKCFVTEEGVITVSPSPEKQFNRNGVTGDRKIEIVGPRAQTRFQRVPNETADGGELTKIWVRMPRGTIDADGKDLPFRIAEIAFPANSRPRIDFTGDLATISYTRNAWDALPPGKRVLCQYQGHKPTTKEGHGF